MCMNVFVFYENAINAFNKNKNNNKSTISNIPTPTIAQHFQKIDVFE